jgi:hypothetical protein
MARSPMPVEVADRNDATRRLISSALAAEQSFHMLQRPRAYRQPVRLSLFLLSWPAVSCALTKAEHGEVSIQEADY